MASVLEVGKTTGNNGTCKCGEETVSKWESFEFYRLMTLICPNKRWWNFWKHNKQVVNGRAN